MLYRTTRYFYHDDTTCLEKQQNEIVAYRRARIAQKPTTTAEETAAPDASKHPGVAFVCTLSDFFSRNISSVRLFARFKHLVGMKMKTQE